MSPLTQNCPGVSSPRKKSLLVKLKEERNTQEAAHQLFDDEGVEERTMMMMRRNLVRGSRLAGRREFMGWRLAGEKPPKGFGPFYPKNGGSSSSSSSRSKKSGTFKSKQASGGGGGGGGGGNELGPRIVSTLAALGLLGVWLSSRDSNGTEINWQEFATVLLESGEVDRIVVTNNKVAEVILRPGAPRVLRGAVPGGPRTKDPAAEKSYGYDDQEDPYTRPQQQQQQQQSQAQRYPRMIGGATASPSYHFAIGSVEIFERKLEAAQRALGIEPRDFVPVQYVNETNWAAEGAKLLPTLLIVGSWLYVMRSMGGGAAGGGGGGGGMGSIFRAGRSTAKKISKEDIKVTYDDVAGCDEAKKEIMEFVEFLKDPARFTRLGAKIPKGALLCGPPGTGKTLLARATAGEASVPFYSISGSEFVEMFVGVGPSRVRDLFKEARANAPCIVFIDEIDAVGRQRGRGGFAGGNDERENTLNQLLVEMDGFTESTNVVVLAGTNRVDVLDKALTRPGRFDRQITIEKPDIQGRKAIYNVHLRNIQLDGPTEDYASRLAGLTPGFAGADIQNVCNEAAIVAARRDKEKVDFMDFESAVDRVIGGLESSKIMTDEEKRIVAFHEAGHAVAGWFLEHADPLLKVTIVPRGSGALGFAQYLPKEISLRTEAQILDIVCMALGGRASEEITFGAVTTGASDDLRRVTQMVYSMIQIYGMNSRVGQLAFPPDENASAFGSPEKPYSDATAQVMDEEAKTMVDDAYIRTLDLLKSKKDQLSILANLLIEKETINHDDIVDVLGARPFIAHKQYAEFISNRFRDHSKDGEKKPKLADGVPRGDEERHPPDDDGNEPGLAPEGAALSKKIK